jgi:xanthine dehydrogenase small subunit
MAGTRNEIRFLLNAREVRISTAGPSDTLLDFLRLDQGLSGTKEGCAEGDCGACTVLVGRLHGGKLRYETVNTCIRLLPSVDGCHVVTVEHLAGRDEELHPVQQALVDHNGSQCGFCTPGFVMSLYALWMENLSPSEDDVETALQGNLCRCTGYEPIVRAAIAASTLGKPGADVLVTERAKIARQLESFRDGKRLDISKNDERAILPANADDLADVLLSTPDATIVAGATDVGLWITKFMRSISPAVFIGHLEDLKKVNVADDFVTLGAGASYTESEAAIAEAFPQLEAFWNRIGGWQVRNMGTVGGNIANGSPIGDTPPVLIALGAEITLRRGGERRTIPLETFFVEYGKQDRQAGDFLEEIRIPRLPSDVIMSAYKISKRRDEDISSVCGAFYVRVEGGTITDARIAFGGMAATPCRAKAAEAALAGQPWNEATLLAAGEALAKDYTPISDWRASAEYRQTVARNLFRRFYLENSGTEYQTRLLRA